MNRISDYIRSLEGKRVAILGAGREARAMASFLEPITLAERVLLDRADTPELSQKPFAQFTKHAGPHYLEHLAEYDVIFRSPGVPFMLPEIQEALKKGIEVTSMTKLFFALCPAPIIGITGSNGKTTTTNLIYHLLSRGLTKSPVTKLWRGGNDAEPLITQLHEIRPTDLVILELSSFQLQDLTQSPHISVITNITPNHLDSHLTFAEYRDAKSNILTYQTANDIAILNAQDPHVRAFSTNGRKIMLQDSSANEYACMEQDTALLHLNQNSLRISLSELPYHTSSENILAACTIAALFQIPAATIAAELRSFTVPSQRLEKVRSLDTVTYINDSACTTPESTIFALHTFPPGTVVLIAGGKNKGMSFLTLGKTIVEQRARVVLIGESAPLIIDAIHATNPKYTVYTAPTLPQALHTARSLARAGDHIVFSPGCASFDMFRNAKERGAMFTELVRAL